MPSKWQQFEWGDITILEYGRSLRNYRNQAERYRVYGTNGPIGWHDEPLCTHSGVVVGRKGAYRGIHYSPDPFFVIDTAFYLEPKQEMDLRWVYYCLLTYDINGMDSGSAIPSTSRESFYRLPVRVPSLPEQRAIAHILGTLDDKIELNRKMNQTLEAMAKAIFKSWFVDFDLVRAKMEGRSTNLPKTTADLFPNHFEVSELGEVPVGWQVGSLDKAIVIHDAKRIPLESRQRAERKGPYPYYGAASAMDYIDDYLFDGVYVLMGEDGSVVNDDDSPVLQYVWGKFWVNNHAHVLSGRDGISVEHLLLYLKTVNIRPFVTGAVQPKLNQGNLFRIPFIMPPKTVSAAFTTEITPLYQRIRLNNEESHTLSILRDTLLPKLISGELRVPETTPS